MSVLIQTRRSRCYVGHLSQAAGFFPFPILFGRPMAFDAPRVFGCVQGERQKSHGFLLQPPHPPVRTAAVLSVPTALPTKLPRDFLGTKASCACAAAGLPQQTITALRAVTVYQVSKPKTKKDLHNDHSGSLGAVTVYQVKNPLFKERLSMCIPNRAWSLRSDYQTRFQNEPGKRKEITPNNVKTESFTTSK